MAASPVQIGPFVGGLNTYSDPTAVGDNEVIELVNFEVDLDGSLVSRPPIIYENDTPGAAPLRLLGYYLSPEGTNYLIGATNTATYYMLNDMWTLITNTFGATDFVQYANKAWLVAPPTNPVTAGGGKWDPTSGYVAVAAMKKGSTAVVYKERMFIAEGGDADTANRVYFSNPANLDTWSASDFVDVKAGDGQQILEMRLFMDVIVIFKQDSTYIYSYDSSPARGSIRSISTSIGVAGKDCVIEYENNLYVFHDKNVYSMINWNFDKLNVKVPFKYSNVNLALTSQNYCMSLVGNRLIVRYYDSYYVYGLITKIWTTWESSFYLGRFVPIPYGSDIPENATYLASSTTTEYFKLYSFVDGYDGTRQETMHCSVTTKTYDFETPYTFKRLSWWGIDALPKNQLNATVYPVTYSVNATWAQMEEKTWEEVQNNTWGRPLDRSISVDTIVAVSNVSGSRMFIKFLKSLRFRQINFKLYGDTDGTTTTGPLRIYKIQAFLSEKAKVPKQIN